MPKKKSGGVEFSKDFFITIGQVPFYDSWALIEVDGRKILNTNDCILETPDRVKDIKKITDTVYKCKLPKEKVIHWQIFYDKDLTKIRKEKFVVGDTSKTINYYSNGIKSMEIWELQDQYKWILDAKYWINGTVCYKLNPSDQGFQRIKHFWSNGKIMFEGDWEAGRFYGDVISYHPNGKIKKS